MNSWIINMEEASKCAFQNAVRLIDVFVPNVKRRFYEINPFQPLKWVKHNVIRKLGSQRVFVLEIIGNTFHALLPFLLYNCY